MVILGGTGLNISYDLFTTLPFDEELLKKCWYFLGLWGSTNQNTTHISCQEYTTTSKQFHVCLIFNKRGVSYKPKANKMNTLLSWMQHDNTIDNDTGDDWKLEIVSFYNFTKYRLDITHKWCCSNKYSVSMATSVILLHIS